MKKKKKCHTCAGARNVRSPECQALADKGILEIDCFHAPVTCPDCGGTGVRGRHAD